jgi:DNA-binding transcriptional LysR family regulator
MNQSDDTTLRQLRYFTELASELHFGRAASQLGISQPALSRQIQNLEKFVGAPLVERSRRAVALTRAGAAFAERARETLHYHERSLETARNVASRDGESLAIGFESCAPFHDFPEVALQFLRRYPRTKLSTFRMSGPEQAEALARFRIDLGFVHPPVPDRELFTFETVKQERFIAALPSSHKLASKKRLPVAELKNERFLLFPRRLAPGCYDAIQHMCRVAGFCPDVVHESNEIAVSLSLIPGLEAVALFPECVRHQSAAGVIYKDLTGTATTVTCGFLKRAADTTGPSERFLRLWRTRHRKDR